MNYYNEHDPSAIAWLGQLINDKVIPNGHIDTRSICDVTPGDLRGYTQCHFFAGIGGWSEALFLAGWPSTRPVWTGSCPCQPFSNAGKHLGHKDERHLWPVFFDLIRQCRPDVVFGEQVASSAVVGLRRTHAEVQQMRDQQAIVRILRRKRSRSEVGVQGVQELANIIAKESKLQFRSDQQTRNDIGFGSSIPSQEGGDTIRSGRSGHHCANSSGLMRADWNSVRSNEPEGLELSVTGSDKPGVRIHEEQCSGGHILSECDESQLGSESDLESCGVDQESAPREVERLIAEIGAETEINAPAWIDGVQDDLEGIDYSFGASVVGASSVGAPHCRQRLYWVAHPLGISDRTGREPRKLATEAARHGHSTEPTSGDGGLGNTDGAGLSEQRGAVTVQAEQPAVELRGASSHWDEYTIAHCSDGKARRVKPGVQLLVDGVQGRVAKLRGFGNAIVPQAAAAFIKAYMQS